MGFLDLGGQSQEMPRIREPQAVRARPEVDRAVLDEEERRKRVQMNREKSRLKIPDLQSTGAGFSDTL